MIFIDMWNQLTFSQHELLGGLLFCVLMLWLTLTAYKDRHDDSR